MSRRASQSANRSAGGPPAGKHLPPGWMAIALGDLGMGRTQNIEPAKTPQEEFELWSVPSFPMARPEIVLGSAVGSNKQRVQPGDVLLCKINPRINRVWCVGRKAGRTQIASTEWIVFRSPLFHPPFLMWRFREGPFRDALCRTVAGVGGSLTRARPNDVAKIEIALPPLAEQRRIVKRLEQLEARSRRARAALVEVPALLAQARQSLLAAAFRGDLTKEWRKTHRDLPSAASLVVRARQAHRDYWLATHSPVSGGFRGPRDESAMLASYKAPAAANPQSMHSMPATWAWASGAEIVEPGADIVYGIVQPGAKLAYGIPYVRGKDIEDGKIRVDQLMRTSPAIAKRYARASLRGGDVLLGIIRATKVAIVPSELEGANITQGTARFRPSEFISTGYLAAALDSPVTQAWLHAHYRGIDMPGLNLQDVRKVPIPLPPLAEQREIVRRLQQGLARLDAAAAAHAAAVAELDRLDQSLLAQAFAGQLVPQNPRDEPASALLTRIQCTRAKPARKKEESKP